MNKNLLSGSLVVSLFYRQNASASLSVKLISYTDEVKKPLSQLFCG